MNYIILVGVSDSQQTIMRSFFIHLRNQGCSFYRGKDNYRNTIIGSHKEITTQLLSLFLYKFFWCSAITSHQMSSTFRRR